MSNAKQTPLVRSSITADLGKLPLVQLRREVNQKLMAATCAFGKPAKPEFDAREVGLLLRVARERFSGEGALLRRQAVRALAGINADDAAPLLEALVLNQAEHDSVRIAALHALGRRGTKLIERLRLDLSPMMAKHAHRLCEGTEGRKRMRMNGHIPYDQSGADGACRG
ncbi:HEAT repeat domain-containing protein [Duganella sp. Root1480D1]|uniref:HEAT repeat domain-containing protein n=1 Tax=Duganella sp. Root1480D1 TaxID=1736471 RepID=UPI00070E8430|nr:HEAT repeat domain-containing protein [Duganella sp. Root1480D1]KQZ27061.1 hypothetical protein ASD58_15945 [Duganella sp. Root1480D1]